MFLDFSVLDEHRSRNIRGTGLGLSICKKIIQKMGGKVSVESTIGKGTTFTIVITSKCRIPAGRELERKSMNCVDLFNSASSYKLKPAADFNQNLSRSTGLSCCVDRVKGSKQINPIQRNLKVLLVNDDEVSLMSLGIIFNQALGVQKANIFKAYNGLDAY